MPRVLRVLRPIVVLLLIALPVLADARSARADVDDADAWTWPLTGGMLAERFVAPPDPYSAGHRGVDIAVRRDALVRAPSDGTVAFAGVVVDRGVLTIDHGAGLVSSYEPIRALVPAGDVVAAGTPIGTVSSGGHAPLGTLHLGVRRDGTYIDPLALLGEPRRAVLLPCC